MSRIASIAWGARKFVVDKSPAILTGMAVAGVITTTFLAVKATPRALQEISEAESEFIEPLTVNQKIYLTGHNYIPAVITGVMTISCIIMAQSINASRYAALMGALDASVSEFKQYKDKVTETMGEGKEQKIREAVAQDKVNADPASNREVIITGNGDVLCYDTLSGRYFTSDVESIRKAVNDVNAQILNDGYASVNEFYGRIGLSSNAIGEELGWNTDNLLDVKYDYVAAEDGKPCLALNYQAAPVRGFYKFG